jgi:uncharacterized membrane protein
MTNQLWWKIALIVLLAVLLIAGIFSALYFGIFNQKSVVVPTASTTPVVRKVLTDQERAEIIKQLSASTTSTTSKATVSDKKRAAIIKQLSAPSTAPKLSDTERQKIINSLSN